MTTKICPSCDRELPRTPEYFYRNKYKKDEMISNCKDCSKPKSRARNKKWREENKELANKNRRNWNKNNRDKASKYQRNSRRRRQESGLCRSCTNPLLKHSASRCEVHWYKNVSYSVFKTSKYWKILRDIAISQGFKCVYTNEELIPNLNMSLDHKKSKYNHPTKILDIDNLQWVTKDINIIKNKLDHYEFIELCNQIAKKFPLNKETSIKRVK